MMTTIYFYLAGVLLHVLFKWTDYAKANPEDRLGYLSKHWPEVVGSAICAIACLFLWEAGFLTALINGAMAGVGVAGFELTVTPAYSVGAGYIFDSIGRRILGLFSSKLGGGS